MFFLLTMISNVFSTVSSVTIDANSEFTTKWLSNIYCTVYLTHYLSEDNFKYFSVSSATGQSTLVCNVNYKIRYYIKKYDVVSLDSDNDYNYKCTEDIDILLINGKLGCDNLYNTYLCGVYKGRTLDEFNLRNKDIFGYVFNSNQVNFDVKDGRFSVENAALDKENQFIQIISKYNGFCPGRKFTIGDANLFNECRNPSELIILDLTCKLPVKFKLLHDASFEKVKLEKIRHIDYSGINKTIGMWLGIIGGFWVIVIGFIIWYRKYRRRRQQAAEEN